MAERLQSTIPDTEYIPRYQPKRENRQLFTDVSLFLAFPDHMPPALDPETINYREKVIAMTQALDEKIMNDSRRKQASEFLSFDVRGIKLKDATCISLKRDAARGELAVTVSHRFAESPKFPRVESEEFKVTDKGEFIMEQSEVHIPGDGCMQVEVAKFDSHHADFTQDIAEKYDYFCQLVQPYLLFY